MKSIKIYFICSLVTLLFINCKYQKEKDNTSQKKIISNEFSIGNSLFIKGDGGYSCFRIPAILVTKKGSLLAFAEARKNDCSDTGNIDLIMRRSIDNGKSWSSIEVVWDDGDNVCGNPSPVVDEESGNIHLLTTWNNGGDHESEIIEGTSKESREVFHQISKDDGVSWSTPKNITKSVKLPNWTWYATGPVHGIQLKKKKYKGRLVVPCDYIESLTKRKFSHVIYSDDQGETWQLGGVTPLDQVNECSVTELQNGNLMLNMRNYDRDSIKGRQIAISKNGGKSWEQQFIETQLPEPICQGAMLSIERKEGNMLLFTNPSDNNSRLNMTLSVSRDDGKSWKEKITIYKSHSAYSDLAELKSGKIIVCYEAGAKNPYEGIYYKILSIQ